MHAQLVIKLQVARTLQSPIHPFSLQFEHMADADCVPAATDRVGRCGKKTCPTYVHYKLFSGSHFFCCFLTFQLYFCCFTFARLLSLSSNQSSMMSGEDRRLECTHAHVNAINPAFKAK